MSEKHKVYVGCCMVILSPDGTKTLVAKRKKEPDIDGMQIPGGTVDYDNGENLENAAAREAEEETGIKIENAKLLCVMNTFYYGKERPIHIGFVGYAKNEEIPPNPEPHKSEDWHWESLDNLPEGKWFRMSRVALDFYNNLKLNSEINRSVVDAEYESVCSTNKKFSEILEAQRAKHFNAYRPWTGEEDIELEKYGIAKTKTVKELAVIFGRNHGAIRSRLKKFGL